MRKPNLKQLSEFKLDVGIICEIVTLLKNERKNMEIRRVGITKGKLRAEPNGSDFNVWIGGTSRTACPKVEAIEFLETNTTADQKADKDAVVEWLNKAT